MLTSFQGALKPSRRERRPRQMLRDSRLLGEYIHTQLLCNSLFGHTFFEGKPSAKKPSQPHCIIEEATAAMSHKVHLAYLCNSISQDLQFYSLNFFSEVIFVVNIYYYPFTGQFCWRDYQIEAKKISFECFCNFHHKENNL